MAPRPNNTDRAAFQERIRDALDRRNAALTRAETEFWTTVGDLIATGHHGAQRDAAEALDYTRDHIRKQVQRYSTKRK